MHDQLATGRKLRVLTVVDRFSRYVPILDVRFNYRGEDVVNSLDRVCSQIGYPKTIRVDNGPEFISRDMDLWPIIAGSCWTSAGQERSLFLEPCRCGRKVGDLA